MESEGIPEQQYQNEHQQQEVVQEVERQQDVEIERGGERGWRESCPPLPLAPFGEVWKNKLLEEDTAVLNRVKTLLLSPQFDAKEIIRLTKTLSCWSQTPEFFVKLLFRTLTLVEENELCSFLIDKLGSQINDYFMEMASTSVLHVIAHQRNPVLPLVEKIILLFPDTVQTYDSAGLTPLHVALQADTPSIEFVAFLLKLNPKSAKILSKDGKLPVHMMLVRNSQYPCLSCLKLLLKAFPSGCVIEVTETLTSIMMNPNGNTSDTSRTSRRRITWTVLSRLHNLAQDHPVCCCCKKQSYLYRSFFDSCCPRSFYMRVIDTAIRILSMYGVESKRCMYLSNQSSFSYSSDMLSERITLF